MVAETRVSMVLVRLCACFFVGEGRSADEGVLIQIIFKEQKIRLSCCSLLLFPWFA